MAFDVNDDKWQQAAENGRKSGKTDTKTEINKNTVIETFSDLEQGKAYSTIELYGLIVNNDAELFDNVLSNVLSDDDDLSDLDDDKYVVFDTDNPEQALNTDKKVLIDVNDLRAFVPVWCNSLTTKKGRLRAKYRKQAGLGDDSTVKRRKIGDDGYENWHFAVVPNEG